MTLCSSCDHLHFRHLHNAPLATSARELRYVVPCHPRCQRNSPADAHLFIQLPAAPGFTAEMSGRGTAFEICNPFLANRFGFVYNQQDFSSPVSMILLFEPNNATPGVI